MLSTETAPRSETNVEDGAAGLQVHALTPAEVEALLSSDAVSGIDESQAGQRLARDGPNRPTVPRRPGYARIAFRQLLEPLALLLIGAAAVSAGIGEGIEALAIGAIVALNAVLGFAQEAAAERAVLGLQDSVPRQANVIRGGRERELPAEEVVRGDLLILREGERISADARLVSAQRLEVDESALTGESLPVAKAPGAVPAETPLADRTSMVYTGTGVTRGRAQALVVATGADTEIGLISRLAAEAKPPPTPLQRRLGRLARSIVVLGVAITVLLGAGMLARGSSLHEAFLVGVAVAVAAVPEGLAATVTIALGLGARAMARTGAIVRRLASIETLGETTVICTDKTGTLTENRLRLAVSRPVGGVSERHLLAAASLASSAELVEHEGTFAVAGDPVEGALLLAAMERGLSRADLLAQRRHVHELPFEPEKKRMAVVYEDERGERCAFVKGAPEVLLERSGDDDVARRALARVAAEWGGEGLRVLAVGERPLPPGQALDDELDRGLRVLGLVALHDPLRASAPAAIEEARRARIEVRMLTGDHPETAYTIGHALGLPADAVFARVTPVEKLRLVESLQADGQVVAVTGDGVNDAPALRRADVGVSMGLSGTEVAREASDVVLTDDDFATIVAAVREGRRIADNVRKFVAFLLSANLGEVVLFAIAILAGLGAPMTVVQVLTVNVLTDGLPALALARDPASKETMALGPRRSASLFSTGQRATLIAAGVLIGLAGLGSFLVGRSLGGGVPQTMAFATIAVSELAFVFTCRSTSQPAWRLPWNPHLGAGVAVSTLVVGFAVYLPGLHEPLGTEALGWEAMVVVVGLALIPVAMVEWGKAVLRRRAG
jgi:Ca2+-transporting ATPase